MAGDWKRYSLGELFDLIPGYAFKSADFKASGVPVIKIKNVKAGSVVLDNLDFVDTTFLKSRQDKVVLDGDILITMSGNRYDGSKDTWVGKIAQFRSPKPFLLNQRVGILRPKKNVTLDKRACAYFLSSDAFQQLFIAIATSSGGQANLSPLQILSAEVQLPPDDEQHAIARVLGTLDDKIELNRRMNETLESTARALFKSWFVDFDPVRTKAEGRDPGLPTHLANLFPDSLAESELGRIPATWRVEKLGDLIDLAYGKALKDGNRQPGTVAVYGSNGQVGWHDEKLAEGPGIIIGRKGNPGVVTWAPTDFFPIDTTFYVVTKAECGSLYFLFYALKDHGLASLGADSAVPGLNRNMAYMSKQLLPSAGVLDAFDLRVRPLFDRIQKSNEQSTSLASLRDTLLPKLISGELRVPDAERIVGGQV